MAEWQTTWNQTRRRIYIYYGPVALLLNKYVVVVVVNERVKVQINACEAVLGEAGQDYAALAE